MPTRSRLVPVAFAVLLATHASLLVWSATRHSPSIDEVGHLAAGLSRCCWWRFDLYRVNPPLVRTVAAAPLAAAGLTIPGREPAGDPTARPEFGLGRWFVAVHGEPAFWYFTWVRWACLPFGLLVLYVCYCWARDLYGPASGLLAAALWGFCPNVLAHAQLIAPDAGAAALGVAADYLFWRWCEGPSWGWAFSAGVVLGLAELCKSTWIFLFALWPALWLLGRWRGSAGPAGPRWRREAAQLGSMLLLALYTLNVGYGFEGTFTKLGDYPFVSRALTDEFHTNCFASTRLATVPIPVPRNYLLGIDVQKADFGRTMASYLRGEWRQGGWWYYYLYGLAVKAPVGTEVLVLLAALVALRPGRLRSARWREVVLLAPAAFLFTLVSSQTGFNHHLRYVLPALPFGYVWVAQVPEAARRQGRWAVAAVAGVLVWSVASSLSVYPHSLSYFNELVGGPERGGEHLIDSNLDWGQDLLYLKRWYDAHPEARPFGLAYYGGVDPRAAGIAFHLPPRGPAGGRTRGATPALGAGPQPGWYAISVLVLRGICYSVPDGRGGDVYLDDNPYAYFLRLRPVARAGYSIFIYFLSPADCDRLRSELGPARRQAPE